MCAWRGRETRAKPGGTAGVYWNIQPLSQQNIPAGAGAFAFSLADQPKRSGYYMENQEKKRILSMYQCLSLIHI